MANCKKNPTRLNRVFQALADPTRRGIVSCLAGSDQTIGQLAEPFEMSMPAITKHVKVLVEAGLVSKRREGKFIHCRLDPEQLVEANAWIVQQKMYWESQLGGFDEFLKKQESIDSKSKEKRKKHE